MDFFAMSHGKCQADVGFYPYQAGYGVRGFTVYPGSFTPDTFHTCTPTLSPNCGTDSLWLRRMDSNCWYTNRAKCFFERYVFETYLESGLPFHNSYQLLVARPFLCQQNSCVNQIITIKITKKIKSDGSLINKTCGYYSPLHAVVHASATN